MQPCPMCGAPVSQGKPRCAACGHERDESPRDSAQALPSAASLLPLAEIQSKIKRQRFRSDGFEWWCRWGAVAGLPLSAVFLFLAIRKGIVALPAGVSGQAAAIEIVNWILLTAVAIVFSVFLGAFAGAVVGLVVSIVKPVFIALFFDADHFEREYGSVKTPKR